MEISALADEARGLYNQSAVRDLYACEQEEERVSVLSSIGRGSIAFIEFFRGEKGRTLIVYAASGTLYEELF